MLLWLLARRAKTDPPRCRHQRRRDARALDNELVEHQGCGLSTGNVVGCVCVDLEVASFDDPLSSIDEFGQLQWSYYGRPLSAFAVHIRHAALVVGEVAASVHDPRGRMRHYSELDRWGHHCRSSTVPLSPECRADLLNGQCVILPAGDLISGDQIARSFGLERDDGIAVQVLTKKQRTF